LLSSTRFSFSHGFADRLMERIMTPEQLQAAAVSLATSISRLFYWVCVPGLAAAVILLIMVLMSGDHGTTSYQHQYTSAFSELLNDYYYNLFK
jgi:TRAP-type C4-dicarboxylate transport system permease large subunit